MQKIRLALLGLAMCAQGTQLMAQRNIVNSLQTDVPGQGKVTLHQDARITALVTEAGKAAPQPTADNKKNELKRPGYRVQIYAGNNTRQARNEAQEVAEKAKESFEDLEVYAYFNPPRWLCRVGNYQSIEEADAMMRKLKATGHFKEVSIVKDQIVLEY